MRTKIIGVAILAGVIFLQLTNLYIPRAAIYVLGFGALAVPVLLGVKQSMYLREAVGANLTPEPRLFGTDAPEDDMIMVESRTGPGDEDGD